MSIIGLQRRMAQVGRIRLGEKGGKGEPRRLETFRLTSPSEQTIREAASIYGGEPRKWDSPAGAEWEVVTTSPSIHIAMPPMPEPYSQWYELWNRGGCVRRCDGERATVAKDGAMVDSACLCSEDKRECKLVTRVNLMLPRLPGVGVWRLDTGGYYAATELTGALDLLAVRAQQGEWIEAVLRLEQRTRETPGQPTKRFVVPVIDLPGTVGELMAGMAGGARLAAPAPVKELPAPEPPALPADPTFAEHRQDEQLAKAPKAWWARVRALGTEDEIREAVKKIRGVESTAGATQEELDRIEQELSPPSGETAEQIAADVFGPGVEVVKEDPHA